MSGAILGVPYLSGSTSPQAEEVTMSDTNPLGRPLPDIRSIPLASLFADSTGIVTEFRKRILDPDLPVRMAAFNSEIGGDECHHSSTSSS